MSRDRVSRGAAALAAAIALASVLVGCGDSGAPGGAAGVDDPAFADGMDRSLELYVAGDLRAALKPAVAALLAAPDRSEPYERISTIYQAMGLDGEAAEFFRKTVERFPDNPAARRALGYHEFRAGNWQDALTAYRAAAALEPDDPEAYFRQGLVLHSQGEFDASVAALNTAHELAPDDPIIAARLARALRVAGDYDGSRRIVDDALRASPGSSDLRFASGVLHARLGEFDRAEAEFRAAIAERPDYREAHDELSKVLLRTGREAEGLREAAIARRIDDTRDLGTRLSGMVNGGEAGPDVLLALAELELTDRRPDQADRWLDRAEARGAPAWRVAVDRAEAAFARGDLATGRTALAPLDAGVADPEAAARADLARAAALVAEGRVDDARLQIDLAVQNGPAEREWLRRAADLCAAAGDTACRDRLSARAEDAPDVLAGLTASDR